MKTTMLSPKASNNPHGFTLTELLITMVILAIVAALTAPAILTMAPNTALKSTTQEILSNVQDAKVTAVKENRSVTLRFDTPGVMYQDDDEDGALDGCCGCAGAEPCVFLGEDLNGNNVQDAGEGDLNGNGRFDTNYNIRYGTGAAAQDWVPNNCVQLDALTFNSRALPTLIAAGYPPTPPSPSTPNIYVQNQEGIAYAITISVAGSVTIRKHDGTNWD